MWCLSLYFFPSAFQEQALHCFFPRLILRAKRIDFVTAIATELATPWDLKDFVSFAFFLFAFIFHNTVADNFFCIHLPIQTHFKALIYHLSVSLSFSTGIKDALAVKSVR